MRLFWSVVLTGGLLFIGLDVYESQKDQQSELSADVEMAGARAEDGTGYPDPPPPPPPR